MAKKKFPWEEDDVSEKHEKKFLLRIPEPDHMKLKAVARFYRVSMHKFCLDSIEGWSEFEDLKNKKEFIQLVREMEEKGEF